MSSINAPTYDPTSTAQLMAQKTTAAAQQQITDQTAAATATATALSSLGSAISTFRSSLASLTGLGKSMLAQSGTFSDTSVASATVQPLATAGTYSVFAQQIASANQVSYNVSSSAGSNTGGYLTINLAAPDPSDANLKGSAAAVASFQVDLSSAADTDADGKLSAREIAASINRASGNAGLVSAGVVTLNGETRLVLSSKNTGEANSVWLDSSAVTNSTLKADLGARSVVAAAKDAIVYFGGTPAGGGTKVQQASNTFSNIDGVSMTITRAQAPGDAAMTLNVGSNVAGTQANVQAFVEAYNKLKTAIDSLADPGNGTSTKAGAFAHDAGVRALQGNLVNLLRASGSPSLASYGITAARDGKLTLDTTRLTKQLVANPTGLDKLIGSTSTSAPSGIAAALDNYLKQWNNGGTGQVKQRTDANTKLQTQLTKRQSDLDAQYDSAYQRYLKQFTALQSLQSTMNSNVSMFDALFSNDKSN